MRILLLGTFSLIAIGLPACTGIKAQTTAGPAISVTDPTYNGGDSKVCTYGPPYNNTTHNDGGALSPARIGPIQTALYYASMHNIPTVTVPANRTCNLIHTQSNTRGTSCFGLDIPNGVTLQGLGNDTILANLSNPKECPNQQVGQLAQTAVFNIGYYTDLVKYNGPFVCDSSKTCGFDGSSGFTVDPTMQDSHTISFASSHPGAESNFVINDYIDLFETTPLSGPWGNSACSDTCTAQPNQVTAVNLAAHTITVADPLAYSFLTPWIHNTTCGKSNACTRHDVGVKNFTISANIFPWNLLECWNVTMDNLTFNLAGGIVNSDQWGVNTAEHWTLSNTTLNWTRGGVIGNQETNQRESGHVLWQNVTIQIPPGDTGGWTSLSFAEHTFYVTYDHVNFPNLVPDPKGLQQGAFMMGGIHNTLSNSTLTMNGNFNTAHCGSPPVCGIVVTSYGNLRGYEGYYTIQNNVITGRADGGTMISVISSGAAPSNSNIVSGNQTKITGGNAYSLVMWAPSTGYTVSGNTNNGAVMGSGMFFNGTGSNCSITNNSNFVTYIGGTGCTKRAPQ